MVASCDFSLLAVPVADAQFGCLSKSACAVLPHDSTGSFLSACDKLGEGADCDDASTSAGSSRHSSGVFSELDDFIEAEEEDNVAIFAFDEELSGGVSEGYFDDDSEAACDGNSGTSALQQLFFLP